MDETMLTLEIPNQQMLEALSILATLERVAKEANRTELPVTQMLLESFVTLSRDVTTIKISNADLYAVWSGLDIYVEYIIETGNESVYEMDAVSRRNMFSRQSKYIRGGDIHE